MQVTDMCNCKHKEFWLSLDVERIEAGEIMANSDDDSEPLNFRDIRIKTTSGEILEITLRADVSSKLMVRNSKHLTMVPVVEKSDDEAPPVDWLTPGQFKRQRKA